MNGQQAIYLRWMLFLVALLLPGIVFAAGEFSKGLLWKVESQSTQPVYLFGTMHSEDKRVTTLPAPVQKAFDSSSSVTLEVKLDMQVAFETLSRMMITDGSNLNTIIGDQLFAKSAALMIGYGMPEPVLNNLKPWAVFVTLSTPKIKTGLFLDKVLYDKAVSSGKNIYGLETVSEQLSIFDDMPVDDQIILLKDTIEYHSKLPGIFEEMTNIYLQRDLDGLVAFNEKHMKEGNARVTDALMERLLVDRNVRMVDRMTDQLKEGSAFIAVGALHLPGKKGILNLLQNKGHKISVVY